MSDPERFLRYVSLLIIFLVTTGIAYNGSLVRSVADGPIIENITTNLSEYPNGQVPRYEKLEITFEVNGVPPDLNEFDSNEIRVDGYFTTSGRSTLVHPGFYYQDYEVSGVGGSEVYTPIGDPVWKIRFAPQHTGTITYCIRVTGTVGTATSAVSTFEVMDSDNAGFIHVSDDNPRYFAFDNGDPFIGAGLNVSWWQREDRRITMYEYYLNRMHEHDANLARVWMTNSGRHQDWILSIQDSELGSDYNLEEAWAFDYILDAAQQNGVCFLLTLDDVNQYTYNWPTQNMYNSALGGPCEYRSAIFTNPEAKRYQRDIFRYIIARWGYSPSILSWELFNEINELEWSDPEHWNRQDMIDWHQEMAQYITSTDAHGHMTNTSTGSFKAHPDLYDALPEMEFAQIHYYYVPGWPWHPSDPEGQDMAVLTRYYSDLVHNSVTSEPSIVGEWGLLNEQWTGSPYLDSDDIGVHLHNGLWSSLMSGMATTGLNWHWPHHEIHDTAWWTHYHAIAAYFADVDITGLSVMQPVNADLPTLLETLGLRDLGHGLASSDFSSTNGELRAMGLRRDNRLVYAWIQNRGNTWWNYVHGTAVDPQSGTIAVLDLAPEGRYEVEQWDPYTGSITRVDIAEADANGSLPITVTGLITDVAVKIRPIGPVKPLSVAISGPTMGAIQVSHTFSATVNPTTTTQPITYVWQATGHSPITNTGGLSDTTAYIWSTHGRQVLTVTATNAGGTVTDTHSITITGGDLPPGVGTFDPSGGSGRVGEWADFTTTYTDPNGYEDIAWASLFLDRQPPIAEGGLAVAYLRSANLLWLLGDAQGFCQPGQSSFPQTDYVVLSCYDTTVSGEGDTLTVNWRVLPKQCFADGCGWNYAVELVKDSSGLQDSGLVGWWRLDPARRTGRDAPLHQPTEADLKRLMEESRAWQSQLDERCPAQR